MYLRRKKQKGVFPCVGRGEARGGFSPKTGGFSPKAGVFGQSRLLPHEAASLSRDMTCADLGQSHPFPLNSSMNGFSKKPF
jgi:hypothetical protein